MSLPKTENFPNDPDKLPPARRRRARRLLAPLEGDERAAYLDSLGHRTSPSFDFFLFSFLAGIILSLGLLLDAPSLLLLGALVCPLMSPAVGISFGTVIGSGRFFFRNFLGLLIGGLLVFLSGVLVSLLTWIWTPPDLSQARYYAQLSYPNFIVLAVGIILTSAAMVHSERRPLISNVAVAFELYIPLAVAGYGLGSGTPNFFPDGLVIFAVYLSWAALLGAFTLALLGFRPMTLFGYTLSGAVVLIGVILLIGISGAGAVFEGQMALPTPMPTATSTFTPVPPTPTLTLTPAPPTATPTQTTTPTQTETPTITPSPTPRPIYAFINASTGSPPGAKIRSEAGGTVIRSYLNNTLVEVLPETETLNGVIWVHIRVVEDGTEGWILQTLLLIATPAPNW